MAMPLRSMRLGDPLWEAALYLAGQQQTDVSAKVRDMLTRWICEAGNPEALRLLTADDARPADERIPPAPVLARERLGTPATKAAPPPRSPRRRIPAGRRTPEGWHQRSA